MKPVWIRYYGILPMTKFGYLVTLAIAAAVGVVVIVVGLLLGVLPPLSTLWRHDPVMAQHGFFGLIYNYMWWVFIVCVIAQAIDTFATMKVFAKKEAEQLAQLEALEQEERDWDDETPGGPTPMDTRIR